MVDAFSETLMGPAIVGVLKLLGPKRALGRMSQTFQYANNYMQSELEELGPSRFRVWVNEVGISPHFIAGTVSATLRTSSTTDPRVGIVGFDGHQCTYAISFTRSRSVRRPLRSATGVAKRAEWGSVFGR